MVRRFPALTLVLACLIAACEGGPGDPLDPRTDMAELLKASDDAGARGLALPGLLRAAVQRVYAEQGVVAAQSLVAELRSLQEQYAAAVDTDDPLAAQRLRATRREELRIVLQVFGEGIVLRVSEAVQVETDRLALDVAGTPAILPAERRARDALRHVEVLLHRSRQAAGSGRWLDALDLATRAGAAADAARLALEGSRHAAGIDELFGEAVARLNGAGTAGAVLERHGRLQDSARLLVAAGDHRRSHEALKAVRDEQIRVVLHVLGDSAVHRFLAASTAAHLDLVAAIDAARKSGADVTRTERMSVNALDMLNRASVALRAGDAAAALDLGSHAAGLLGAARLSLAY